MLAVGGGCIIDGTKFISAAVNYRGYVTKILKNRRVCKNS
jgi:alcohol dehydrogenase YqhD (iron-dependent ADH family)